MSVHGPPRGPGAMIDPRRPAGAGRPGVADAAPAPIGGGGLTAGSISLTMVSIATAISLCRVFPGWSFLLPAVVVVVICHAAAAGLRALQVPAWLALPIGVSVLAVVVSWVFLRDTLSGPLPWTATWDEARRQMNEAWNQFGRIKPPVDFRGGFGLTATVALGAAALVSDAFAFRAYGRSEAVVPAGVVFIAVSALGEDRNRVAATILWIVAALTAVAVLRAAHAVAAPGWMGHRTGGAAVRWATGGAIAAVIVAIVAGFVGPRLPGADAQPLLDPSGNSNDVTRVVSPLVDIKGRLAEQSQVLLFSVAADRPQYWRLTGLPSFDGSVWGLPDTALDEAGGRLSPSDSRAVATTQSFDISNLGGNLVPAAFAPTQLLAASSDLFYVTDTGTLVVTGDGLTPDTTYDVVSSTLDPSPADLRAATVAHPPSPEYLALPRRFPDDLRAVAEQVTAAAPTPYDKALALQDWFRTEFTYDLNVPAGHSDNAIEAFLKRRTGYCEQFAGSFAALGRAVGLPVRVAVGFTPGTPGPDGRYIVRGLNAHAWPEVWFDGLGWVLFEPTPGRGAPGAENHTGVAPQQDETGAAAPTTPDSVAPAPAPTVPFEDRNPAATPGGTAPPTVPVAGRPGGGGPSGPFMWFVAFIVLAFAWSFAVPALAKRAAWARGRNPTAIVATAWDAACNTLGLVGTKRAGHETPTEFARRASSIGGIAGPQIRELAQHVTLAAYSARPLDDSIVRRSRLMQHSVHEEVFAAATWQQRLRARMDPLLAWRLAGAR